MRIEILFHIRVVTGFVVHREAAHSGELFITKILFRCLSFLCVPDKLWKGSGDHLEL